MKLDKELEDLTKHWKEEKERKKREGKDQEVAQMAAEIMAHCVNLGGFNCPSQKWFNIVFLDEERTPQKFWSYTTIFSLEKLSFHTFWVMRTAF